MKNPSIVGVLAAAAAATLLSPSPGAAQTTIPGGTLTGTNHWDPSGSPYVIQGDLTIAGGATLTIAAGVQVQLATSDAMASGADSARVEIVANGALVTQGTAANPVTFTTTGASGTWYGIRVLDGTETDLTGAHIEKALYGVSVSGANTHAKIASSKIMTCKTYALYVSSGRANVDHTVIAENTGSYAVYYGNGSGILDHVTVASNAGTGVYLSAAGASVTLSNSIVASNSGYGVYRYWGSLTPSYNNVWGNRGDYDSVTPDSGSISANPLFVRAGNYRITSMSPSRLAASDGTDQGALAYGSDATPGLQGKLVTSATWSGTQTLAGDLIIPAGVTLTLAAGATLSAAATDGLASGADTTRVEIIVYGALVTQGTAANPVTLTTTGASGAWYGIRVLAGTATDLTGADVEKALNGVTVSGATTSAKIAFSTIRACQTYALDVLEGRANVGHTVFAENRAINSTVSFYGSGGGTLDHVTVADNSGPGIYVNTSGTVTLSNSIIASNVGYGVYGSGKLISSYNNAWGNASDDFNTLTPDSNTISANPLFVGSGNYRITSMSPSRLAAADGTDQGALAYGSDATPALQGKLMASATWTGNQALAGDLIIPAGVTLTLAPGATLSAASTDGLASGIDTSRVEIIVYGALVTQGTAVSPVTFTTPGASGTWYGIRVLAGTATDLTGADVEKALYGVTVSGATTVAKVAFSRIAACQSSALFVTAGRANVDHTLIAETKGRDAAVFFGEKGGGILDHVTVAANGGTGVYVYSGGPVTLSNSIVASNGSNGINGYSGTLTLSYNNVWGNSGDDYKSSLPDSRSISANPLFVGSGNYRLTSMSPSRSAAGDGTDQGALAYLSDATPGLLGELKASATWRGELNLLGDLIIPAGVTLTLAAGTTLTAAATDGLGSGSDVNRVEIIVQGALVTQGASGSPVTFTTSGVPGAWYGIRVLGGKATDLTGADIQKATVGVSVSGAGAVAKISSSTIRACQSGALDVSAGSANVDHSVIANNSGRYALSFTGSGSGTLDHLTVTANSGTGLYAPKDGPVALRNSIVASNSEYGWIANPETFSHSYDDVWDNPYGNSPAYLGVASISANPLFASATDYHLQQTSPCRGAGSDGSDIGALPYQVGAIDRIVVSPSSGSVAAGDALAFNAQAFDAANNPIPGVAFTWTALPSAGAISAGGLLTAACAPATIAGAVTASAGGKSGSASVTLTPGPVTSIALSPTSASLAAGDSTTFTATAKDRCGNARPSDIVWSVARGLGAIVSGQYTAPCQPGSYSGAVIASVGSVQAAADVSVRPGALSKIALSPSKPSLPTGVRQQFRAASTDRCGNVLSPTIAWSANPAAGTISSSGLFTAGSTPGFFSSAVTARSGGLSASTEVTVTAGGTLARLDVAPASARLAPGETATFSASGKDSLGNPVAITPVWSVVSGGGAINPATGTFTAGTVAGTFANTVEISAGGLHATASVTVTPGPASRLSVIPSSATLGPGGTTTFSAQVFDAYNNLTTDAVTWSVLKAAAGTITQSGAFTAGTSVGSYPNAVKATAGGASATASVTVEPGGLVQLLVTPGSASVQVGADVAFVAKGFDRNGNPVSVTPSWIILHGGGTITSAGVFTAGHLTGSFADTVQAQAQGLATTASVNVTEGPMVSVTVTPSHPTLAPGARIQLTATASDAFGNRIAAAPAWSCSAQVGTIDATGEFTAGTTAGDFVDAVTATVNDIAGHASVRVLGSTAPDAGTQPDSGSPSESDAGKCLDCNQPAEGSGFGCASARGFAPAALLGLLALSHRGRRRRRRAERA